MTEKEIYEAIKSNPNASLHKELFTTNIFGETIPIKGRSLEVIDGKVHIFSDGTESPFEDSFATDGAFERMQSKAVSKNTPIPKGSGITTEKLAWYRENNMLLGSQYDRLAEIGDRRKREEEEIKTLSIKYLSCSVDDTNFNLTFEVSQTNLKKFEATIFVMEMNATNEIAVPKTSIKLSNKQKINVTVSFSKKIEFDHYFWQSGFIYQATITCDGLSAETEEFSMKCVDAGKDCICKKNNLTADDLKYIIMQLRKLDTRKIIIIPKDKNGNKTFLDKNNKVIPSTDRGKRPEDAVKLNETIKDLSFYDDFAEDNKKNEDRLFLKKSNDLNIKSIDKSYLEFAKQLNATFKKYKINTCLRKLHFFTQCYVETQKLTTSYETNPNSNVFGGDFYRGRGLKQITHDYNYLRYYDFINKTKLYDIYMTNRNSINESVVKFNQRTSHKYISEKDMEEVNDLVKLVSTELYYACDSAGWYWQVNKINDYADKDDIKAVSALVNNPSAKNVESTENINGYDERKKFYDLIKIVFNYENCK